MEVQKLFYNGYILPLIDYGSNAWGSTSVANLTRLLKLQKRAARIILHADFLTPSQDMFKSLGWMTIADRHRYNKAVITFKAINGLTPQYITDLLKPISEQSSRALRSTSAGNLLVPRSRTKLYDGSFGHSAAQLWNALPSTIRTSETVTLFKSRAKTYINGNDNRC